MELRSGRLTNKCGICKEYYGNPEWNNKCSNCSGMACAQPMVFDEPEFQNDLNDWVQCNLIEKPMENVLINVCRNSAYSTDNTYFPLLRQVLQIVKMSKKYISAELAEKLCRNIGRDTWNKSQLILQFVADWWNMKNYKFTGAEMCYFGRYGDINTFREEIKSIPPPPPNSAPESIYRI